MTGNIFLCNYVLGASEHGKCIVLRSGHHKCWV